LGSFFDQKFKEGYYEANPPFTPELFDVMVSHMNKMLDESTGPLSFIIFAPAWIDDPHWKLLTTAKYYTYNCIIPSSDHTYCDGAFHKQPKVLDESNASKYRPAPFDTGIVWFQNKLATSKWPITKEVEEDIRKAFSVAKPSLASLERAKARGKYIPKSLRPKL
jgi:phosphorylated CTD-interacting factor 1